MNSRIKLGPLAIFLAIIAIILAMLAMLSYATGTADLRLAERYAEVTQIKYDLEMRGNEFLKKTEDEAMAYPSDKEVIHSHTEENGDYTLSIDYSVLDGRVHVIRWRIGKEWTEQNIYDDILH